MSEMLADERESIRLNLRSDLENTIDARIERFSKVRQQGIAPNHHFTPAISEW
jgi:hypothetical protein